MPTISFQDALRDLRPNDLISKNDCDRLEIEKARVDALALGHSSSSSHELNEKDTSDVPIIANAPNLYNNERGDAMSNYGYVQLSRHPDTLNLMEKHPLAFLLLTLIAIRAKRKCENGLNPRECLIGDHKTTAMTRQQYRTALDTLVRWGYVVVVETCRTRQKFSKVFETSTKVRRNATTQSTTLGTKVKLLESVIYDINEESINHPINHPINHRSTTDQPPINHEQEDKNKRIDSLYVVASAPTIEKKSPSKKRIKKDPDPLIERDKGIFTSETAHKKLIEVKGSEQILSQIYSEMSIWKAEKGKEGGNDYRLANNWNLNLKNKSYKKVIPKYNHDTSPSLPSKKMSFAEEE